VVDRSNHVRLRESDRELEDQEQDIRGWPVQDEAGGTIGTVSDLMLNTDTELVDFVVLDDGNEYPVDDLRLGDGVVYLYGAGAIAEEPVAGDVAEAEEEELRVQRSEEELRAGTREREVGNIRVRKRVETDQERIEVPTRREEVSVDRVPINEETTPAQMGEEEVSVPLTEEEVVVEKRPVAKEEVRLRKDVVSDTEVVEEDIRKEEVDVDDETHGRR
jgi:uncharacterized protein (TIGR02271 family)